jgi:hypothetical protein
LHGVIAGGVRVLSGPASTRSRPGDQGPAIKARPLFFSDALEQSLSRVGADRGDKEMTT